MQKEWIRDPRGVNARDTTPLKNLSEQEVRYSTAARRFSDLPEAPALTALLRTFLEACVPSPRATEFQYWSVSTGRFGGSKFPRRFCISVGMMEVLVVHGVKDSPGAVQGILNVRESTLLSRVGSLHSLRHRHPGLRIEVREYVDAGGDLLCLKPRDLNAIEGLLADPDVTAAAAQLVLDLMRKHFCVYTRGSIDSMAELSPAAPTHRPDQLVANEGTDEFPATELQAVIEMSHGSGGRTSPCHTGFEGGYGVGASFDR